VPTAETVAQATRGQSGDGFLEVFGIGGEFVGEWLADVLGYVADDPAIVFDCLKVDDEAVCGDGQPEFPKVGVVDVGSLHDDVQVGMPSGGVGRSVDFEEVAPAADAAFPKRGAAKAGEAGQQTSDLSGEWLVVVFDRKREEANGAVADVRQKVAEDACAASELARQAQPVVTMAGEDRQVVGVGGISSEPGCGAAFAKVGESGFGDAEVFEGFNDSLSSRPPAGVPEGDVGGQG